MEAGPWRRIQAPDEIRTVVRVRGHRCAVFWYGGGDDDIRSAWIPVPCQSWWVDDGHAAALGFHGIICWLLVLAYVQDVQRGRLEEEHAENGVHISRSGVCDILRFERLAVGREILWSGTVWDNVRIDVFVVRNLGAAGVCWELLWVQAGSDRGPCSD